MAVAAEPPPTTAPAASGARAGIRSRSRSGSLPLVAFFVMSDRRLFCSSQVFIYGLFALSLDLILGYAGILSLGHAAFFGVGAYTAGLLARHGWPEPLPGLGAAAARRRRRSATPSASLWSAARI